MSSKTFTPVPSGEMPVPMKYRRHWNPAICELHRTLELAQSSKAPQEVIDSLERALQLQDMRDEYDSRVTYPQSEACGKIGEVTTSIQWGELHKEGKTQREYFPGAARMMSGHLEGQVLKSLVSMSRARRVLDVGMFTGYSALSLAEALPPGGQVVSLDRDPFLQELNTKSFAQSPHGGKIRIMIGPAMESMEQLLKEGEKFDFMFLDADKSEYKDYLKIALEDGLLAENGTVAVDNAYMFGRAYVPSEDGPSPTGKFADLVIANPAVHRAMVPVRDGVMLIRRLSEVERDSAAK